ncbi:hypothetical protein BgiMline_031775 [Biomphalaria glabrata]|nr:hypothetical protein BgiMline_019978 [Biomphalaria glabrata]
MSLVEENDRILMYGKVDFNGNIPASSVVNFEIKRKTDMNFHFINFIKIPEDCDYSIVDYCTCYKTEDQNVYRLSFNITAYKVNSEAEIRAELVYRETSFYSEIRKLPIVYGSQTDMVVVYVNDQVISPTQSSVTVDDTQVRIFSTCLVMYAPHCKLQLTNLDTGAILKSGKQVLIYNTDIKNKARFDLKYKMCNIQRNISFSIIRVSHFIMDKETLEASAEIPAKKLFNTKRHKSSLISQWNSGEYCVLPILTMLCVSLLILYMLRVPVPLHFVEAQQKTVQPFPIDACKSSDRGKTIILQENVSKSMDIHIASSNIDTENTISIRCNNITLYVCRKDNVCTKKTKSNIFNVTKTKDGNLRVYFENVVRNSPIQINGTWHVCNAVESGNTCNDTLTRQILIYTQLDYFNCTYYFGDIDHNLTISCTMKNIYPQPVCSFGTGKVLSSIQYDYSQDSRNITRCSVTLDINEEFYQVKTTMYPNITGDITDMTYGINMTLSVMNVSRLNSSETCFVEGNSTSISPCRCVEAPLENVTTDSYTETDAFIEVTLNRENSQPVYCNTTTQLSERTTVSENITELSSSKSTTSLRYMKDTSVSPQPPIDFDHTRQGTASLMTTSLTIISIVVFTLLTMILLYRFVSYPNHYTTIEDLKKEKERQSSESFYTPSELTQNGDFHVLKNFRTAGCSMQLEKNWDLDIYEKI